MFATTHTIRQAAAGLALAAAVAALLAPTALAGGGSNNYRDGWYGWAVAQTKQQHAASIDGRSPDTRDAATAAHALMLVPTDGRSPDTLDAARTAQSSVLVPLDGRSPDTIDAAVLAHSPTVTLYRSSGFEWGDFGIGVAAAFGLLLLAGAFATSTRAGRQRLGLRSV